MGNSRLAAQAAKAGAKAAGAVIDDAAVTPKYVHGFAASFGNARHVIQKRQKPAHDFSPIICVRLPQPAPGAKRKSAA
ncbi:MAG: DUF808 family protein [Maritimibacter sp.]